MTDQPTSLTPQLNTALADLAAHWEQMANHYTSIVGCFEGPTAATLDAEVEERSRTYRDAAADLREVLATGRIPHDLKTAAVAAAPPADKDAVIARKDREYATCERLLREAYKEIARLRDGNATGDAYAELLRTAHPVPDAQQD